ncbi:Aspartate--ammonia ligase [uncultured Flavonifractor sp.]|jgi:aspartate--ammonia ligase|uniref:aspartate--ammonia ligase n=1 Tax=Intestinimonas TaxID=1392389 RepID=UPI0006C476C6|nr:MULTISPECIES: aspartate--ammonia ligase [Intestinimonas]CUQ60476.1 aspartate--ammonia ligase AsnA [Flavonifractor plautii]SCJ42397.1 Aspartate--ammonia ligase [uncultured Flavonifractor sp.]BDE88566.1 aspartate--ammonia ligase [Oscillospiraceae bacterium]MCI5561846.1 aspartate--ammonia ligase [Intestinimonas massiliensis (ex Afouda et al. 2020)]MDY5339605.1 aspartate--ammonia ligase [Intestinimonas sp.]
MSGSFIPPSYAPKLNLYDTQKAIGLLKRLFEDTLGGSLNLRRVSAPLFVEASTGLNDDLNGVERPVSFDIPAAGRDAQVVHSLAKWKRLALHRYQFSVGEGLYTDMNAIRRDEEPDNLHSVYVDQWDWEKVLAPRDRNEDYLKETVRTIVECICQTQATLRAMFPQLLSLPLVERQVTFVTAQELEDRWPDLSAKEREDAWVKDHPTTFLMGIGGALKSGRPHDGRAPDYDDWALNGDILVWNPVLERAFELSSMGIRVSPESLDRQLTLAGCDDRRSLPFHRMLLSGELPLTIGGGIGQSRLCMLLLGKAHIGEVQASVWDPETLGACQEAGVVLL